MASIDFYPESEKENTIKNSSIEIFNSKVNENIATSKKSDLSPKKTIDKKTNFISVDRFKSKPPEPQLLSLKERYKLKNWQEFVYLTFPKLMHRMQQLEYRAQLRFIEKCHEDKQTLAILRKLKDSFYAYLDKINPKK